MAALQHTLVYVALHPGAVHFKQSFHEGNAVTFNAAVHFDCTENEVANEPKH
jgi:hypothetical protein